MKKAAIFGAHIFEDQRELALFSASGIEASYYSAPNPAELIQDLQHIEILIVNLEPVTGHLLSRLPNLKVIGRYGVGFDNIDVEAATERGIAVINVPDYCVDEVAEHAVSFLFAANRKLIPSSALARRGGWSQVQELKPIQSIKDITLGVVGTGRIGFKVIEMMAPFGMRLLVHDPYLAEGAGKLPPNAELVELDLLLEQSDIITIHCPLNAQTHHLLNAEAFGRMKRQPAIVNVSRGAIIAEADLLQALELGQVSFAALDVLETEPPPPDHELLHHPQVLVTNHIAWYSLQSEQKLRDLLVTRIIHYLDGKRIPSQVNPF